MAAEVELTNVLSRSGVSGPYVLVGHSLGGLFAEPPVMTVTIPVGGNKGLPS